MKWTITEEDGELAEIARKVFIDGRQYIRTEDGVVIMISEEEFDRIKERRRTEVSASSDGPMNH